jgi:multiple sugar transport system substrate-binding protein
LAVWLIAGCGESPDSKEHRLVYQGVRVQLGVAADSPMEEVIEELCREWEQQTGGVVDVVRHDADAIGADPASAYKQDDVFLYPPWAMGALAAASMLTPLPEELLEDDEFAWQDVVPALRKRACVWEDEVVAAPLGTPTLLCYFRRDLLEQHSLTPPQTWEDYFRIADRLGELATTGDGGEALVHAVAEPLGAEGRRAVFLSRAAAYAKHPNNYSFLFNMRTMQPLIANEGFVRALEDCLAARDRGPLGEELHRRIDEWIEAEGRNAYGDPADTVYAGGNPLFDEATGKTMQRDEYVLGRHPELHPVLRYTARDVRRALWEGRAALGLAWERSDSRVDAGDAISIGVARLPGAAQVFDATRSEWDPVEQGANRPTVLGASGQCLSVSAGSKHPEAAFDLVRFLCANEARTPLRSPGRDLVPYRTAHFSEPTAWVGPDMKAGQASQYVEAVRAAFESDAVVPALRIPGSRRYMDALDAALEAALTGRAAPPEALEDAASKWEQITEELGLEAQRAHYRRSLGLAP